MMSKLRFCGTCGLDLQKIPRKFARKYRRDPDHCPRCGASTDADVFTLPRQNTAARVAAGPLIAPLEPPPPKTTPQQRVGVFINTIVASLIATVIVLATLVLLGVITLPRSLPTTTHTIVASPSSMPTMTPTNMVRGAPTIMTITPYALATDCDGAMTTTSLINTGSTAFRWSATIISQGAAVVPFQLSPMSGLLHAHATQTLTLSDIVQAGAIVISANGIAESIIVTCTAPTVTPSGTTPPQ